MINAVILNICGMQNKSRKLSVLTEGCEHGTSRIFTTSRGAPGSSWDKSRIKNLTLDLSCDYISGLFTC